MKNIKTREQFSTDPIVLKYFKTNPIVHAFLKKLQRDFVEYYETTFPNLSIPVIRLDFGSKFIKIWSGQSCWGFISRVNGIHKNAPIKKGDLLKPASWRAPAKHSRGNIINGTASYDTYGPTYLHIKK